MIRKYSDYGIKESAKKIVSECVDKGSSVGWAGSIEEVEQIETICDKFNVHYVCDFKGEWAIVG